MSKLIERLEKVDAASTPPLGFGASRTQSKPATMLLVALADAASTDSLSKIGAEFCVLSTPSAGESDVKTAGDTLGEAMWGLWSGDLSKEKLDGIKEQGGDFFVFSETDTPVEVLSSEELGRLIAIPADFPEELGRALEELPLDAVVMTGLEDAAPLSVKNVMQVRCIRDLTSKPMLILRSRPLTKGEFTVLQDTGIQGIVLDSRSMDAESALGVKEAIDALPPRKTKRDQPAPVLPRFAPGEAPHHHEEDPDDKLR